MDTSQHGPARTGPSRTSRATWVAVAALCAVALAARMRGIGYQLPHSTLFDGAVIVRQVADLRGELGADKTWRGDALYPKLLSRAVVLLSSPAPEKTPAALPVEDHVRLASKPWREIRSVSALLSVLLVPATFLLARSFLSSGWSLLAAALVATSLLHAVVSAQVRAHGVVASFVLLAVVAAVHLRNRPRIPAYWIAGAMAGLAIGALHNGIFALPPLFVAIVLRRRLPGRASLWWVLVTVAVIALCVRVFYPFQFAGDGPTVTRGSGSAGAVNLSGHALDLGKFNGAGWRVILATFWSYDPALLFTGLFGACAWLVGRLRGSLPAASGPRRLDLLVVLAHALPYTLVVGLYAGTVDRVLVQLIPYAALLAAFGASRVPLPRDRGRVAATTALVVSILLVPSLLLWKLGAVRSAPDTRTQAVAWLESSLPPEARILAPADFDLPAFHSPEALSENSKRPNSNWVAYQAQLAPSAFGGRRLHYFLPIGARQEIYERLTQDPLEYLAGYEIDYVLLPGLARPPVTVQATRSALETSGERVFHVEPGRVPGAAHLPNIGVQNGSFVARLWNVRCTGVPIEVWALD